MKRILAAVDFSDATPGVLQMATKIALTFHARLHLLHVIEPEPNYSAFSFTPDEFPIIHAYQEVAKNRATDRLTEELEKILPSLGDTVSEIRTGNPLHCLLDYAKECQADLVIIGAHAHSLVASMLFGSVAEGIVRKACVATLIVPTSGPT